MKRLAVLLMLAAVLLTGCVRTDYTGVILAMAIDGDQYTFAVSAAEGAELLTAEGKSAEEALEKAALASPRRPVYGNSVLILVGEEGAAKLPVGDTGATVAGAEGKAKDALREDVLKIKRIFPAAAKTGKIKETSLAYARSCFERGQGVEVPLLKDGAVSGSAMLTKDGLIIAEVEP